MATILDNADPDCQDDNWNFKFMPRSSEKSGEVAKHGENGLLGAGHKGGKDPGFENRAL